MKALLVLLAATLGLATGTPATAQSATDAIPPPADSPTRAEVKSEAKAAERSGEIPRGQASANMERDTTRSVAKRPQVKAATKAAEKSGQLARGEASKNMGRQVAKSTLPRTEVKAEAKDAEKNHEIPRGESSVNN